MYYNNVCGEKLSALGFGCMRLPVINGNDAEIDEVQVAQLFERAIEGGINYFDTAWGYHNGMSEIATGKALSKYPRNSFHLASKFPGYDITNMGKVSEIFERQLEKTGAGYFDYYLFHNVCEMNIDGYLNRDFGIMDYLLEQKKNGRIRHLGFSAHGNLEIMSRFLDAYADNMEFCQIQLNWLDWHFQDAKSKVELLNSYKLPIWVMEPLRGGKLARLSDDELKGLHDINSEKSPVEWAFDFLKGIPNIGMILSGMSDMKQLNDNLRVFSSDTPLTKNENDKLLELSRRIASGVPCTACRYCTEHCPQHINIPEMIKLYNEHTFTGGGFIAPMALMAIPDGQKPADCIGCRSCEALCPQKIKISEIMSDFAAKLSKS